MHKPIISISVRRVREVNVAELLPWAPAAGITGFVIAVLYAILRGALVPRGSVDARVSELQQVVVLWKDAAEANKQLVAELLPLAREGVDNDKLVINLISGLKDAVGRLEPSNPGRRAGDRE